MPQIDLGQVVGPQGAQGNPGPQGAQGIQGPAGAAATINGHNALTIDGGDNIELEQQGGTVTLSVLTDAAPTAGSTKPVQSGGVNEALANKAPGGFGFGDALQRIGAASAEESYETYCAKVDAVLEAMPDRTAKLVLAYPPALYGKSEVTVSLLYKGDANYAVLSNIGSADTELCGWRMIKMRYPSSSDPSAWQPFEWENPPIKIGVEYRTSERYNGKPVYAKAINFGQAPNATYKDVSHEIENFSQLVSYTGMMGGANLIEAPALDNIQINASTIRITTNTDVSASYVYLVLRYTKTTD